MLKETELGQNGTMASSTSRTRAGMATLEKREGGEVGKIGMI